MNNQVFSVNFGDGNRHCQGIAVDEKNGYIELTTHYDRFEPMHNNPIHGILD